MPLVPGGRAECGILLSHDGEAEHHIFVWVWTQVRHRASAEAAIAELDPSPWRNHHGSFLLTLDAPKEGESYDDLAGRVADSLWALARPIAEAVAAER